MKLKILIFLIFAILLHNTVRNGDPTVFFSNAYYKDKYVDELSDNGPEKEASVSYAKVIDEIDNASEENTATIKIAPVESKVIYSPDVEQIFKMKVSE
jgi:hypothetical protein